MFFSEMTTKDALKSTKQKITGYQTEFLERMNAIEVDAHWFRRVFHTFAASFLIYYLLPDEGWLFALKQCTIIGILLVLIVIEFYRIRGHIKKIRFFGLRGYEQRRPAGYLFFGTGTVLLFLFFPQQIVIPCLLCAAFIDPLMGEIRFHYGKYNAILAGFVASLFFFSITWYRAEWWVIVIIAVVGGTVVTLSEAKKLPYIDDDFLIQILPAVLLLVIWQVFAGIGIDILPATMILPL
ncbi:MAG TPA: dolichol kinase [Candidatus Thermoplasmatota archaeon]|nr:dolichol kinase [Candidatus Thermoplasmatota archaeon]